MPLSEIILNLNGIDPLDLFGLKNTNLHLLQTAFPDLTITARGSEIKIAGEKKIAQKAKAKVEMMIRFLKEHQELSHQNVRDLLNDANPFANRLADKNNKTAILYGRNGKAIKAKTKNQKVLVEAVENNDVVFAIGPAGTGKTYTGVALAVRALKNKLVRKIILTRPAVEAGESLGFLPGDLKEKVDPYLRPLYDALDDMIPPDKLKHFTENRVIEVAPLAFMRGRTLDNAFIILDEAQNCTSTQLKMFLTRLGPSAKCIITGDLSQIDLPGKYKSGLKHAINILTDLEGIAVVRLTAEDVVRHRLVREVIKAYERNGDRRRFEEE